MPKRRPGRPALEPHERRVNRGIRLPRETWQRLSDLAAEANRPEARVLEALINEAWHALAVSREQEPPCEPSGST